jgi:hypothetical protein
MTPRRRSGSARPLNRDITESPSDAAPEAEFSRGFRRSDTGDQAVENNPMGGEVMKVDFNSILLLIIAVEIALIYVKLPRK